MKYSVQIVLVYRIKDCMTGFDDGIYTESFRGPKEILVIFCEQLRMGSDRTKLNTLSVIRLFGFNFV